MTDERQPRREVTLDRLGWARTYLEQSSGARLSLAPLIDAVELVERRLADVENHAVDASTYAAGGIVYVRAEDVDAFAQAREMRAVLRRARERGNLEPVDAELEECGGLLSGSGLDELRSRLHEKAAGPSLGVAELRIGRDRWRLIITGYHERFDDHGRGWRLEVELNGGSRIPLGKPLEDEPELEGVTLDRPLDSALTIELARLALNDSCTCALASTFHPSPCAACLAWERFGERLRRNNDGSAIWRAWERLRAESLEDQEDADE